MITYSIIRKSQLGGAERLDAEYYQPEYLELENIFHQSKTEKIIDLTDFVRKGVFDLSPDNYIESGIPFVRVQNIKKGFLDEENLVFISEQVNEKEKKTELRPLDIVLSKVGTVGEVSIIPSHFSNANFSQNVIGLKIKTGKIPKGFLALFLLSKLGQLQIARANMLQVQAKLELKDIRDLLVVRLEKEREEYFHEELLKIEKLFEESKSLYTQAEDMLLEELGLTDFEVNEDLYSVVNFLDVRTANRMDAEYFQPKYERIISVSRAHGGVALNELVTMKKGFEPGADAYEDEGKLFIRVSSISKHELVEKTQKYINKKLYEELKKEYEPKKGEILLTKDASPGVAYALDTNVEGIISSGILRLKLKEEINPDYLALCINSVVGQMQVERDAGGSVIAHWKPEQVKNLIVPVLAQSMQDKIAKLVRDSHAARKKAKELLEEAKRKVEELIESKQK